MESRDQTLVFRSLACLVLSSCRSLISCPFLWFVNAEYDFGISFFEGRRIRVEEGSAFRVAEKGVSMVIALVF